jgi:hypothetical protein
MVRLQRRSGAKLCEAPLPPKGAPAEIAAGETPGPQPLRALWSCPQARSGRLFTPRWPWSPRWRKDHRLWHFPDEPARQTKVRFPYLNGRPSAGGPFRTLTPQETYGRDNSFVRLTISVTALARP